MTVVLVAVLTVGDRPAPCAGSWAGWASPRCLVAPAAADDGTAAAPAAPPSEARPARPDAAVASRPATPRAVGDLDGLQIWIGPTGGAARVAGAWDSAWGGGIQVLRVRETSALAAVGVWIGGVHYAARDGGRIWLDGVAGTRRLGGRMLGISLGPALELGARRHPRPGAAATLWWFTGVTPYVRAGALRDTGGFVELGVALALPAWRR